MLHLNIVDSCKLTSTFLWIERVLRILAGAGYVVEYDIRVYAANAMTRYMSTPGAVAVLKFGYVPLFTTHRDQRFSLTFLYTRFDVCMPLYAKAPDYFRENGFQTPLESNKGLFQYVEKTEESMWSLLFKNQESMDDFYVHMTGRKANRPTWIDWFPVQECIIDGFEDQEGGVLLVDVAGGRGHDLEIFHAKFSHVSGCLIVEDLPQVLEGMTLSPGIECQPFDLFEPQPVKGDTPTPQ
jgi:hypothetical protein